MEESIKGNNKIASPLGTVIEGPHSDFATHVLKTLHELVSGSAAVTCVKTESSKHNFTTKVLTIELDGTSATVILHEKI